jgi:MFS family permease
MPLLVLHTTGSVVQMGLITALGGAAALITGVFAGAVADRFNRRALLIISDVARFLLYAAIPLVWLIEPQLWLIYAIVPIASCFAMMYQVTHVTVVPSLVSKEHIIKANGRLYATTATAFLAGPALAGAISGTFGPQTAIAVDAASFALSAVALLFVKFQSQPAQPSERGAFLAGARFLWNQPVLRALTLLLAAFTSISTGLTDVFIFKLKHDLSQPDRVVGYVMAASFVGTLLASLVVPRVRQKLGFGTAWIAACVLCGLAVLAMAWSAQVVVIAAMAAAVLFATGIAGICSMSLRQEITPSPLLGRVTSAFWTLHGALNPAGIAILAVAAGRFGTTATLFVAGSAIILIALSAILTPVYTHQLAKRTANLATTD